MKIEVIVLDKQVKKFKKSVIKKSRQLEKFLRIKKPIDVYLVAGRWMRKLNKEFLKRDKDTNVISMVSPKSFFSDSLGEVYLNPLFIKKNKQNLDLMLAHGVLHILGYDHKGNSDRIKMEKKEAELLLKIRSIKLQINSKH